LKLQNPLQIQRIAPVFEPRTRDASGRGEGRGRGGRGGGRGEGRGRDGGRGGRGGGRGRASEASNGRRPMGGMSGGNDNDTSDYKGPKRSFGAAKKVRPDSNAYRKPKNSLRLGTQNSKKGRSAQKNMSRGSLRRRDRSKDKDRRFQAQIERKTVELSEGPMTVGEVAEVVNEKPVAVIKFLMTDLGVMAAINQSLDPATCVAVVEGFGYYVGNDEDFDDEDDESEESALDVGIAFEEEDEDLMVTRPPVVTIMGHVDHGKTSLLDAIRNTQVTAGEAGGITQHIGAYQIERKGQKITFIDTPGHAAFTDMRQRGANITDIVILVVAADDGVKQQTADSIACARQAGVPLLVAINKIDLPTSNIDRVKADLTAYDVLAEDLGGDVLFSEISAKEKIGLDELIDNILIQAEIQGLKANSDRFAQGAVVEAKLEKGLGTVATTLIQKGTLRVGDTFFCGITSGKVKALISTDGKTRMKEAGPSTPVRVVGFDGIPSAGDILVVCEDEQMARDLAMNRARITREKDAATYQAGLMQSVAATFADGKFKEKREMCVVVKADVQGSAEALTHSLRDLKLENDEAIVTIKVLVSEAGEVTKSDVAIASVTTDTTIIAFNCAANFAATEDARKLGIPIEYYNIVYDAIESVECRMQEVLSPTPKGEYIGAVIVQEVFNIGGTGNIAGSKCTDGYMKKGSNVRIMRGDKILAESKVRTLRSFKSEVDRIDAGDECGVGLIDFEEFLPGDVIESYIE